MLQTPPPSKYALGSRVRVTQRVRVGSNRWQTEVIGVVEKEGLRPVGGMEMGGKGMYCRQPTLRLRKDNGEITVVALDDLTEVETIPQTA